MVKRFMGLLLENLLDYFISYHNEDIYFLSPLSDCYLCCFMKHYFASRPENVLEVEIKVERINEIKMLLN